MATLSKKEQRELVSDMCRSLRRSLLEMMPNVPPEWDGLELRQWLADVARERFAFELERKRKAAYKNERLVRNI